jgi:type IV secretion system protein VirB4
VVLATQSLSEIANSSHGDVILESCTTKLYLPNPEATNTATRETYRRFGLSDRQVEIIADATPKRHYYYVSPLGRRLFQFSLGPAALASSERDRRTTYWPRDAPLAEFGHFVDTSAGSALARSSE